MGISGTASRSTRNQNVSRDKAQRSLSEAMLGALPMYKIWRLGKSMCWTPYEQGARMTALHHPKLQRR